MGAGDWDISYVIVGEAVSCDGEGASVELSISERWRSRTSILVAARRSRLSRRSPDHIRPVRDSNSRMIAGCSIVTSASPKCGPGEGTSRDHPPTAVRSRYGSSGHCSLGTRCMRICSRVSTPLPYAVGDARRGPYWSSPTAESTSLAVCSASQPSVDSMFLDSRRGVHRLR